MQDETRMIFRYLKDQDENNLNTNQNSNTVETLITQEKTPVNSSTRSRFSLRNGFIN